MATLAYDVVRQRNTRRATVVHALLGVLALGVAAKAVLVQVVQHARWAAVAQQQHRARTAITPDRGALLDATGAPLAETRIMARIAIAPREVRDRATVRQTLASLGLPDAYLARVADPAGKWVPLPGRYYPSDLEPIARLRGVYLTHVTDRTYVPGEGIQRLLGRVNVDGHGADGLERKLDTLLRGTTGEADVLRSGVGERLTAARRAAIPGATIRLTVHRELQDIAEAALGAAMDSARASGGDLVVLEPHTGAIRALVSLRRGGPPTGLPALVEPYEPGSTLKPFYAAALLATGKARATDVVPTYNGSWVLDGRTIRDEHKAPRMTLREVIEESSNIGAVQFQDRLTPTEIHGLLTGLGLGARTGIPYPGEARGRVPAPKQWSNQTKASLAMGYELLVTPVQLAAAYATLANGGLRVRPTLIADVRPPVGRPTAGAALTPAPAPVRLFPAAVTREVVTMMSHVVQAGTAQRAGLRTFTIAGKTGTAKRTVGGRYGSGYTASFVGLFPAEAPQLVVLIKLDNPQGAYHGGAIAAPVMRSVVEALLAARDTPLDRRALLAARHAPRRPGSADPTATDDGSWRPATARAHGPPGPAFAVRRPPEARTTAPDTVTRVLGAPRAAAPRATRTTVPPVSGRTGRDAVHALHAAGLTVTVTKTGLWVTTQRPAAGTTVRRGTPVHVTLSDTRPSPVIPTRP